MIDLNNLNTISESCWDGFYIHSFDGYRMILVGSKDISYNQLVEVEFVDVAYCSCSVYFNDAKFRIAKLQERKDIGKIVDLVKDEIVFAIEADAGVGDTTFFIVAKDVTMRECS